MDKTISSMRFLVIFLILFLVRNEVVFSQVAAHDRISFSETINLDEDQLELTRSWPNSFNFENDQYFLYVRAWYTETIDGKTVQVENAVYNLSKTTSGFQLFLKNPGGKLSYLAIDNSQSSINKTALIQSFVATEGQTHFTLDKTPAEASVWLNGLLQFPGVWSINDNDIVLASPANGNDEIGVSYREDITNNSSPSLQTYTLTVTEKYLNEAADNNPGSVDPNSRGYAEGTTVDLANDFSNEGLHFEGFSLNENGTNLITELTITQNTTVYAIYDYTAPVSSTLLNGLIAAYEFEETSGTSLIDSSSNKLNGTNNGATINQSGYMGKAYNFNNLESDYIQLPNASFDFEYNSTFSISIWFKPTSSKTQGLFFKSQESDDYRGYGVWLEDDENVTCRVRHNTNNHIYRRSNSSVILNEWNHVLFMYDGSTDSNGANLYINGIKETSWYSDVSTLGPVTIKNSINTNIGARNDGNSMAFSGSIDQTVIWDRVLTDQEITELYNNSTGKAYPFNQ